MFKTGILHHLANGDGTGGRKSGISISQQCDIISYRGAHMGNNRLTPPRPFINIFATFSTYTDFAGIKSELIT